MTKEQMFYKAINGKEYRIFKTQYNYYITTIEDGEHTDNQVWVYLENAQKYIRDKIEENKNNGLTKMKTSIKAIDPQPCENCAIRTDVIEREEYDLLKRQLANSFDRIDELDKLNGRMREQINKAIEEMKKEVYEAEDFLGIRKDVIAFDDVLEILKRNIGE